MKFLSDIIKIAYYEFLMHIRSWRFRLSFLIVLIVSFLLKKYIDISIIDIGIDRLFLITLFLLIANILISIETVGIIKKRNIHNLLMPKPFSILALSIGQFISIIVLMSFLSALIVYLPLLLATKNIEIHFTPSTYILTFALLPNIILITALTIWIRTVFKYDIVACIITIIIFVLINILIHIPTKNDIYLTYLSSLNQLQMILSFYSPSIGMVIYYPPLIIQFINTLFVSLFLLTLSCYHSRRSEPQRKVLINYGKKWHHMPTFIRFIADAKIDKRVGREVHLAFFTIIIYIILSLSIYSYSRYDSLKLQEKWNEDKKELIKAPKPEIVPAIGSYSIKLTLKDIDEIDCSSKMGIYNPTDKPIDKIILSLNKTLKVKKISCNGKELIFKELIDKIFIDLDKPLNPLGTMELLIQYNGCITLENGRLLFLKTFTLNPHYKWYPQIVEFNKSLNDYTESLAQNFRYDLSLNFPKHLVPITEEGSLKMEEKENRNIYEISLNHSLSQINIMVGNYKHIDKDYGDLKIKFYYLNNNEEVIDFLLNEYKDYFQRMSKVLGKYTSEHLILYENPFLSYFDPFSISSYDFIKLKKLLPEYKKTLREDPYNQAKFTKFQPFDSYIWKLNYIIINQYVSNCIKSTNQTKYFFKDIFKNFLTINLSPIFERTYYKRDILLNKKSKNHNFDVFQSNIFDYSKPFPDFSYNKGLAIYTMLRLIMGDEKFIQFIQAYLNEFKEKYIDEKTFIQLVEKISGEKLDWFLEQWFYSDKIPEFEITKALAEMFDDKKTIGMDYKITVIVKNKSKATTILPIYIETEGDQITEKLFFKPEEEKIINLIVPDRPLFVALDPDGWIIQIPKWDNETHSRIHDERKFEIIELQT